MQGVEQMTPGQQGLMSGTELANYGLAAGQNPYIQQGQGVLSNIAGGGNQALNTAQGALSGLATGQNPFMQQVAQGSQGLMDNPYVNAAQQANAAIASGANLDPSKNTALQAYLNAGLSPMISNYQQAVAPNILSNAVTSGGLGSSGTEQAFQNAQSALANQMGNYTAQVIEPAYEAGLGQQAQAIGQTTGLLAPQEQGLQNMQNLAGLQQGAAGQLPGITQTQMGAATAQPGMLSPQQGAIGQMPGLVQGAYTPTSQLGDVGQQQQQQQQNILNTIFGNQMTPYQMSQMGANLIGALGGGGGQSFQVSSTPGGSAK
jgi:hypothetical protein